jgi:hypothetical protein
MARRDKGYVQQRIGERDHHMFFGEFPAAYLVYSHIRLDANPIDGQLETSVEEIARECNLRVGIVKRALLWLASEDEILMRPPYIRKLRRGNQHHKTLWEVVKYGQLRASCKSMHTPGVVHAQPSMYSQRREFHCAQCKTITHCFDGANGTKSFAFELGASIFHDGQFPLDARKRIGNEFVDGFMARRKEPNALAIDFIRYAKVREARIITYAARKGNLSVGGVLVKPGSDALQKWMDARVHEKWKNVERALAKYKRALAKYKDAKR